MALALAPEEERCGQGGASDRGPFSGDPSGGMELRVFSAGRTRARLVHRADMLACEVVAGLHVATRAQVAAVLGGPSREVVSRLFRLGFLDRLETGRTPPAYAPGPVLRRRRGMDLGLFTPERFLRQVAASQLYLALPGGEWRSEPRPGFQARWDCAGRVIWVACPREWPHEVAWFRRVVGSLREGEEVLVVAGTPALAAECARACPLGVRAYWTWDRAVVPGGPLRVWAWDGEEMVPAGGLPVGGAGFPALVGLWRAFGRRRAGGR